MPEQAIIVPPDWFPPSPFFVFGRATEAGTEYRIHRPHPAASLPLIFQNGAEAPADFPAHFKKCLGEKAAP